MLTEITRGKGKGTWQPTLDGECEGKPRWAAIIRCPECNAPLLVNKHTIAADGQISPSVGHPDAVIQRYGPCSWHVNPKLLGWNELPPVPPPMKLETCARCGVQARCIGGWGTHGQYQGLICAKCHAELIPRTGVAE